MVKVKFVKITLKVLIPVIIFLLTIFFAISPIAKYIIGKNSMEWTGRKITMDHLFINLLNLDLTVKGINVFEMESDTVFFSAEKLHTGFSFWGLIKGEYRINPVEIVTPVLRVEKKGSQFNFDDLIRRFAVEDSADVNPQMTSKPLKYKLETISVINGIFSYSDKTIGQAIVVQGFNLSCPSFFPESPSLLVTADFKLKSGGKIIASLSSDLASKTYTLNISTDSVDLRLINPYLNNYVKASLAEGSLNSLLEVSGRSDTPGNLFLKGNLSLNNFSLVTENEQTVAAWNSFMLNIDSINTLSNSLRFGEISLDEPYLIFEMYDKDNNFSRLTYPTGSSLKSYESDSIDYSNPFTIIAGFIEKIGRDYISYNYTVGDLAIRNGHFVYKDYTLEDKFTYDLEEFNLRSTRIDSRADSITLQLSCLANRSGRMNAYLAFDPQDFKNMTINYAVENMRISDLNPYSKFYIAHTFAEGMMFYSSTNTIHEGMLKSTNRFNIKKIDVSRRIRGKGLYSLPLRLAVSLLRDSNGNINLDIPVEGNLKDPKYRLGKVIWQVLKNIVVKAAKTPAAMFAKIFGSGEEELRQIGFDYLQRIFDNRQMRSIDLIGKALTLKPDLNVELVQVASRDREKELLAFSEAKKRYYLDKILRLQKDSLGKSDFKTISQISNRDSLFTAWLNNKLLPEDFSSDPNEIKTIKLLGEKWLDQQVDSLFELRNQLVFSYLTKEAKIVPERLRISNTSDEKSAQFESSPFYKIVFFAEEGELDNLGYENE